MAAYTADLICEGKLSTLLKVECSEKATIEQGKT